MLAWHTVAILLTLFGGITRVHLGPVVLRMTDGTRLMLLWAASLVVLLLVSRRARHALRDQPHAPVVALVALVVLTVWLSFGPYVRVGGRNAGWPGIYMLLHDGIPGANALRVPPRIAMMTAMFLAMLGGVGAAALLKHRRAGAALVAGLSIAFLIEAWPAPIPVNLVIDADGLARPPASAPPFPAAEADVQMLARLPADAVLVELPFGSMPYEIRWQYLAIGHWRARVNGYSGGFPDDYQAALHVLSSLPDRPA
jgi:hypothetical protein